MAESPESPVLVDATDAVAPQVAESPVALSSFDPVAKVAPQVAESPAWLDCGTSEAKVAPQVVESPEAGHVRPGVPVVAPQVAESPCSSECAPPPAAVAPQVAESPLPGESGQHPRPVAPQVAEIRLQVRIKGLPTIRCLSNRPVPPSEDLKVLTINRKGRRLYVNLTYEVEVQSLPPSTAAVGIDMGITDRMALSNGEAVARREFDRERIEDLQQRRSRARRAVAVIGSCHGCCPMPRAANG